MMEEWEGAGLDVVDDVDCMRGYVFNLCPRVASGGSSAYGTGEFIADYRSRGSIDARDARPLTKMPEVLC